MMEDNKKKSAKKMGFLDFDMACSCGSGEIAGACCKSSELCPCGSGEMAGACCYSMREDEDEEESM